MKISSVPSPRPDPHASLPSDTPPPVISIMLVMLGLGFFWLGVGLLVGAAAVWLFLR